MIGSFTVALLNVYDKVGRVPNGVVERYGPDTVDSQPTAASTQTVTDNAQAIGAQTEDAPAVTTNTGGIYDEPAPSTTNTIDSTPTTGTMMANQTSSENSPAVARMNTFSALLDITHPHIFEMPIIILVLCHFLMRTRLPEWMKIATYVLSFSGVAGMLATPWLVRYVSINFAPLMIYSAIALGISAIPLIFVTLFDMWIPGKQKQAVELREAKTKYPASRSLDKMLPNE